MHRRAILLICIPTISGWPSCDLIATRYSESGCCVSEGNVNLHTACGVPTEYTCQEIKQIYKNGGACCKHNSAAAHPEAFCQRDYIVIGSGPGGTGFARRVLEEGYSVLMFEQGKDLRGTPFEKLILNDTSISDIAATGFENSYSYWDDDTGKLSSVGMSVGGGTAINFQKWNQLQPEDTYAYFPLADRSALSEAVHSTSVRVLPYLVRPLSMPSVVNAGAHVYGTYTGVGQSYYTEGTRGTTGSSAGNVRLIAPMLVDGMDGFTLQSEAAVAAILFDSSSTPPRAIGVRLEDGSEHYCRREVILAGGPYFSPKLLMDSGVGPRADLESNNVSVVVNLDGVGKNYRDTVVASIFTALDDANTARLVEQRSRQRSGDVHLFLASGALGHATNIDVFDITAAFASTATLFAFLYTLINGGIFDSGGELQPLIDSFSSIAATFDPPDLDSAVIAINVEIPGSDPAVGKFTYRGVDNPLKLESGRSAARDEPLADMVAQALGAFLPVLGTDSTPLLPLAIPPGEMQQADGRFIVSVPGLSQLLNTSLDDETRAQIAELLHDTTTTNWHQTGTCAQGLRRDGGVVDAAFRVYGTQGLRVVDTSTAAATAITNTQPLGYVAGRLAANMALGVPTMPSLPGWAGRSYNLVTEIPVVGMLNVTYAFDGMGRKLDIIVIGAASGLIQSELTPVGRQAAVGKPHDIPPYDTGFGFFYDGYWNRGLAFNDDFTEAQYLYGVPMLRLGGGDVSILSAVGGVDYTVGDWALDPLELAETFPLVFSSA